jgi:hypothetical protein
VTPPGELIYASFQVNSFEVPHFPAVACPGKYMPNPPEAAVEYALDATDLVALLFSVVAGWRVG